LGVWLKVDAQLPLNGGVWSRRMHRVGFWQHFVGARLGVDPLIVGVFIWYASSVMEGRLALSRVEARIAYAMRTLGCIVNGPGEMADADYGYVGSGKGKITLYRGKEVVKRGVPAQDAVDELIGLIREDGNWIEPGTDGKG